MLAELERLHSRAEEARRKSAKAEAAAEHKRTELAGIVQALKDEYGVESWDQASGWVEKLESEAAAAVAEARSLIENEGILE